MRVAVEGLSHSYEDSRAAALQVEQLIVPSGTHQCLVGRSGSGKTTLLNILAGLLTPNRGQVWLGDTAVHTLSERQRDALRARSIGYVFQTSNLLQGLSVLENLTLSQHFAGRGGRGAQRAALQLLERLGLGSRARAKPGQLSVGELQRVGIARAVCKEPALVLADEPTASLDDESAAAAIDLLLAECAGRTLIVASHDKRLIERMQGQTTVIQMNTLYSKKPIDPKEQA